MDGTPLGCAETRLVRISLHIDGSMQHVIPQWLPLGGVRLLLYAVPSKHMTPSQIKTSLLATTLCAALTACGGGDDSETPTTTPTASAFVACFDVSAGVAYTMADVDEGGDDAGHHGVQMLKESFEGAVRSAGVNLTDTNGIRTSTGFAGYWSQESNGLRFWGGLGYDSTGAVLTKTLHSDGFVLPLARQAGQSTVLAYTDTISYLSGTKAGQTETASHQETWTFEGFESLTLGGKTFTDTCRVKTTSSQIDGAITLWFAKGFGIIRGRHTNSAGVMREESSLETITAQP